MRATLVRPVRGIDVDRILYQRRDSPMNNVDASVPIDTNRRVSPFDPVESGLDVALRKVRPGVGRRDETRGHLKSAGTIPCRRRDGACGCMRDSDGLEVAGRRAAGGRASSMGAGGGAVSGGTVEGSEAQRPWGRRRRRIDHPVRDAGGVTPPVGGCSGLCTDFPPIPSSSRACRRCRRHVRRSRQGDPGSGPCCAIRRMERCFLRTGFDRDSRFRPLPVRPCSKFGSIRIAKRTISSSTRRRHVEHAQGHLAKPRGARRGRAHSR